jgi:hypothetical protein
MPNGSYWVGRGGFNYKRSGGGGNHRIFSLGAICNQPQDVNNVYVAGAGVGASSIATRRARLLHSTVCNSQYPCNKSFSRLGLQMSGGSNDYAYNWYLNDVWPNPYPSPRTPNCSGISGSLNKIINSISGTGSLFGSSVSWSPDMTKLAIGAPIYPSADDEGIVYICNADGTLIRSIQVANQGLSGQFGTNLSWSPDGTKLAIGSPYYSNSNGYGRVYIYDPNTGLLINTIISPLGTTTANSFFGSSLAWSPDSSLLAIGMQGLSIAANQTGRVYIYNNSYVSIGSIDSPTSGIVEFGKSLSWSNGGTKLAIGATTIPSYTPSNLGFIYVYNPYTLAQINTIFASNVTSSPSLATNIAWSPDDSQIAFGEPNRNSVLLLNSNTGAVIQTINNPSSQSSKFGSSLSWSKCSAYGLYSSQLAIGAQEFNSFAGIVYIYS